MSAVVALGLSPVVIAKSSRVDLTPGLLILAGSELRAPVLDRIAPDLMAQRLLLSRGEDPFRKGALLQAVDSLAERPLFKFLNQADLGLEASDFVDSAIHEAIGTLKETRSIYMKPGGDKAHSSRGVANLQLRAEHLRIRFVSGDPIYAQLEGAGYQQQVVNGHCAMAVPIGQTKEVVREVVECLDDEIIIEEDHQAALYQGRQWEIRFMVQAPKGRPQVVAMFLKHGGDDFLANVCAGGASNASPLIGVQEILLQNGVPSGKVLQSANTFLRSARATCLDAYDLVRAANRRALGSWFPGVPGEFFYPREIAFDVTGALATGTNGLTPKLVEVQYPSFGIMNESLYHVRAEWEENRAIMLEDDVAICSSLAA